MGGIFSTVPEKKNHGEYASLTRTVRHVSPRLRARDEAGVTVAEGENWQEFCWGADRPTAITTAGVAVALRPGAQRRPGAEDDRGTGVARERLLRHGKPDAWTIGTPLELATVSTRQRSAARNHTACISFMTDRSPKACWMSFVRPRSSRNSRSRRFVVRITLRWRSGNCICAMHRKSKHQRVHPLPSSARQGIVLT